MWFVKATAFLCFLKLFVSSVDGALSALENESFVLSKAVQGVINKLFVIANSELYVFAAENDHLSDIMKGIIPPVEIEDKPRVLADRRRFFVLIIANSMEDFEKFNTQLTVQKFYLNGIYILVFPTPPKDMESIFRILWNKLITNINIITQVNGSIEMFTFMPFRNVSKCGDETSVKINEFDAKSLQWSGSVFLPSKFDDLHKCPIKCGAFKLEPAIIIDNHKNGSVEFRGFDVDLFNGLMHSINARVNYTAYPIDTGKILANGSGTGLLGHNIRGDVDASLRSYSNQVDRRRVLTDTVSYFGDKLIMV